MSRTLPLRHRLLLSQGLAILLLAAGVLTAALWGARRAVQSLSRELVDRAALEVTEHLQRLYEPAGEHLRALGELARLGLVEPGEDPGALRRLALPWFDSRMGIGAFGLFADDGRGVAMRRTTDGWEELSIRPDATPVASDGPPPFAFDPRQQAWWLAPPTDDPGIQAHWSDRVEGGLVEHAGLAASRRIVTAGGEGRVVVIELLLDSLLAHLAALEVTAGTVTGVLDGDGRLIAWSGPDWPQGATPESLFLKRPRDLGVALFDDARQELDTARSLALREALRFSSAGEAWWGRLRPFALPGGGEQLVAVLVPARDLLRDRTRQIWAVLGLTGLALAVALASARRTGRNVAAPVETLVERSARIASGDLEPEPLVTSGITEVQQLATAQESMRAGLRTLLKLERDLQIASQIQRATWPSELPVHPGLDIAAAAHPADETGGDGYDLVPIPGASDGPAGGSSGGPGDRGTFLFLADATGHGIGPALSVTQLRAMLRMAVRSGHGLAEMLKPVNDQLCADLPGNRFITAWFGQLDADGRGLESLSAGQAPLLHYHAADDRLEVLKADVPPLGLFPVLPAAKPRRIELAAGDLWVVLSDGFFEATDPAGEELGVERIGAVLRRCRALPAVEILAELRAELERFTAGAPAADDQTALLLRRTS
jgi:serine phosphatase RsbU (regulator of sigma subunit)